MSWIDELSPEKRLELERMRLDAIMALVEKPNEHLMEFVRDCRREHSGQSTEALRTHGHGSLTLACHSSGARNIADDRPALPEEGAASGAPTETQTPAATAANKPKRRETGGRPDHPRNAEIRALIARNGGPRAFRRRRYPDGNRAAVWAKDHRAYIYKLSGPMGRTQRAEPAGHGPDNRPAVQARGEELLRAGVLLADRGGHAPRRNSGQGGMHGDGPQMGKLIEAEGERNPQMTTDQSSPPDPLSKDGEGETRGAM